MYNSNIPYQIKAARERAGLTQQQLAYVLDTNNIYVSLMENGRRPVSMKWLEKIAIATESELVVALIPKEEPKKEILQVEQTDTQEQNEPFDPTQIKPSFY